VIAWLLSAGSSAGAPDPAAGFDLVCLSGRGDKDLAEVVARLGELDG
jgi:tryptophan synthase beta subunit